MPKQKHKTRSGPPRGVKLAERMARERARAAAVAAAASADTIHIEADKRTQRIMWLMVVSLAEAYGLGPKRLTAFFEALQANSDEFERMTEEVDFEYAAEKLRRRAEQVTGIGIEYAHEKELAEARRMLGLEETS